MIGIDDLEQGYRMLSLLYLGLVLFALYLAWLAWNILKKRAAELSFQAKPINDTKSTESPTFSIDDIQLNPDINQEEIRGELPPHSTSTIISLTDYIAEKDANKPTLNKPKSRTKPPPLEELPLVRLAEAIISDQIVNEKEARLFLAALTGVKNLSRNRRLYPISKILKAALIDNIFSASESAEIKVLLSEYADSYIEIEEKPKVKITKSIKANTTNRISSKITAMQLGLTYIDTEGKCSERVVNPIRVTKKDDRLYLTAFCNSANGMRTFRIDRIKTLFDAESGELFNNPARFLAGNS